MRKKSIIPLILVALLTTLCSGCLSLGGARENAKIYEYRGAGVIEQQTELAKQMRTEFKGGRYSLEKPYVVQDPYGVSPLTALIGFTTETKGTVTVEIKGKDEASTITHRFSKAAKSHLVPVYGLYADVNNEVKVTFTDTSGTVRENTLFIQTGQLPDDMVTVKTVVADKENMAEGLIFAASSYLLAYDANGDIRWYLTQEINPARVTPIKKLKNGHLLFLSGKLFKPVYYTTSVYETDLLGKVYAEYITIGAHHEIVETPGGDLIVAASKDSLSTEDYIIRVNGRTGKLVDSWDIGEFLNIPKEPDPAHRMEAAFPQLLEKLESGGSESDSPEHTGSEKPVDLSALVTDDMANFDWFHNNSFYYDEAGNSLIISGKHKDAIIKIDASTREVIWILSDPNIEWTKAYQDKLLTPLGGNFEYTYGQHAVTMLPDGNVMVFDNGDYKSKNPDETVAPENNYSRAVIFHIEQENMTVQQVWQYGKERGSELYSGFVGDVDYLGENHYLLNFGGTIKDSKGNALDQPHVIKDSSIQGVVIEIKDNVVVNEVKLGGVQGGKVEDGTTYRAEKVNLYDDQSAYVDLKQEGKVLGKSHYQVIGK